MIAMSYSVTVVCAFGRYATRVALTPMTKPDNSEVHTPRQKVSTSTHFAIRQTRTIAKFTPPPILAPTVNFSEILTKSSPNSRWSPQNESLPSPDHKFTKFTDPEFW